MRFKIIIFIMLLFLTTACKKDNKSKIQLKVDEIQKDTAVQKSNDDIYLKDLLQEELIGIYEYKGLYDIASMIDCPDFVEFRKDKKYYIYNDCGMTSQFDTISEKGNYEYDFKNRLLKFYNRILIRQEYFFDNSSDTLKFRIKDIKKDTLLVNIKGRIVYFKK